MKVVKDFKKYCPICKISQSVAYERTDGVTYYYCNRCNRVLKAISDEDALENLLKFVEMPDDE